MRAAPTVTITNNGTTQRFTSIGVNTSTAESVIFQFVANGAGFAGVYGATAGNAVAEL